MTFSALDESNGHVFLMSPRPVGTYPGPRGPAMVPMVLGLNGKNITYHDGIYLS